jgi:hypothetical protein
MSSFKFYCLLPEFAECRSLPARIEEAADVRGHRFNELSDIARLRTWACQEDIRRPLLYAGRAGYSYSSLTHPATQSEFEILG